MKTRIRGFVLAAGHGMRLRPLTLFVPKPLLPVGGEPVMGRTLHELARVGCEAVAVNLHHLPEAVSGYFGRSYCGLPLVYSHEKETILGTFGALYPQRDFLAAADVVLLVNGDTLCRWPWKRLVRRHLSSGADATLLLHRQAPREELGGGVGVDGGGRVVALRDASFADQGEVARRHVFAGAHVLSRRLLDRLVEGPGDIIEELYKPLLADGGHIASVVTRGAWHDLGTAERYLEANLEWTRRRLRRSIRWISPLAEVHPGATVQSSVVAEGVRIGEGAHVEDAVLLAGATVAAGSRIERSILGPGVHLPSSANIEGRMINRTHIGHQIGPGESVMGELIYTPLAT